MNPDLDSSRPTSPLLCISEDENEATLSSSSDSEADNQPPPNPATQIPEWRGNWKRQLELRDLKRKEKLERKERKSRVVAGPPIPEMRFEEGVLLSIRRFLHLQSAAVVAPETEKDEEGVEGGEMVEKQEASWNEIFLNPIRVEWGNVAYVLIRDQIVFQLLTGFGFAVGTMWLSSAARAWKSRP